MRTTLSSLRKNLGDWIEISQDSIQLASETWVDVRQFLENPGPPVQDVYILESVVVAGRAGELKRIRELAGRHQLLSIEGEPGIGKTRMVGEYLKEWKGIKLIGTAQELEKNIPYQPIAEALCSVFEKQLDRT